MKWVVRIGLVLLMINLLASGFAYGFVPKSVGQVGVVFLLLTSPAWLRVPEEVGPLRPLFFLGLVILCLIAIPRRTRRPLRDLWASAGWPWRPLGDRNLAECVSLVIWGTVSAIGP